MPRHRQPVAPPLLCLSAVMSEILLVNHKGADRRCAPRRLVVHLDNIINPDVPQQDDKYRPQGIAAPDNNLYVAFSRAAELFYREYVVAKQGADKKLAASSQVQSPRVCTIRALISVGETPWREQ